MTGRLAGEVAVVTGSTAGLGKEVVRLFAAEGARTVVTGRNVERGEAVAAELVAAGGEAVFVAADLADEAQARGLMRQAAEHFGPVTVLVNNAVAPEVIAADRKLLEVPPEVWQRMYEVIVLGATRLIEEVMPGMLALGHGSIVNISSRTAERASPKLAAYTAAKGALNALGRSITLDYARQGIRCNTVQPGYVVHETRDADMTAERRQYIADMTLTRPATARDVAYAILFFASREAECISGATLQVDGGSSFVRARTMD